MSNFGILTYIYTATYCIPGISEAFFLPPGCDRGRGISGPCQRLITNYVSRIRLESSGPGGIRVKCEIPKQLFYALGYHMYDPPFIFMVIPVGHYLKGVSM